jgi:hypothetical protein
VPVADIHTFPENFDPLLRTLLAFCSGRKPYEPFFRAFGVEIGGETRANGKTVKFWLLCGRQKRNPQSQQQQDICSVRSSLAAPNEISPCCCDDRCESVETADNCRLLN